MSKELKTVSNIKGKRYGRLVAEEFLYYNDKSRDCWKFKCDCGGEKIMPAANVKWGRVRSCGCLLSEHAGKLNQQNIAGERFGRIVAVRPTKERDATGSIVWECQCECGNTAFYSVSMLRRGAVKSCGCLYRESRKDCPGHRKDIVENTLVSMLIANKVARGDNTSGYTGVYLNKKNNKWIAYITFRKKRYYLGSYFEKEQAVKARKEAEGRLHDPIIKESWEKLTEKSKKRYLTYLEKGNQNTCAANSGKT